MKRVPCHEQGDDSREANVPENTYALCLTFGASAERSRGQSDTLVCNGDTDILHSKTAVTLLPAEANGSTLNQFVQIEAGPARTIIRTAGTSATSMAMVGPTYRY
jgi:hypothetical protein